MNNDEIAKTTRSGRTVKLPNRFDDYKLYVAYCLLSHNDDDPTSSYQEAIKQDDWKTAIESEINSLENINTWTPTILPDGKQAIDTKWVFHTKENGTKKARLVAKGFQVK